MSQSAKERVKAAVNRAIADGDSMLANEITANIMTGTAMMFVFALMLVCLVLNEFGLFAVDKSGIRWAVLAAAIVEVPITIINDKYTGMKPWLRRALLGDLVVVCAILSVSLGHNVALLMVLPVIISTRYFDSKYTGRIAVFSAIIFLIATVLNGFFGVTNLNVMSFTEDAVVSIQAGERLRDVVARIPVDYMMYVRKLLLIDFLPRCFFFIVISLVCCLIAKRGKDMIELESAKTRKTARLETELDLATRIQTSMLPCLFPAFPEHQNIDLQAIYHPAKEVGGDFYDYFNIDKTHVGVVIADVSGKGVGAALFMTISKTVIKNQLQMGISPAVAMTNANRQLCENNDAELFVTCWAGVYDTETRVLTFVNAGHNPPVVLKGGEEPQYLSQRAGFVLAGMDGFVYKQQEIRLEPGDEMFFYTDGVTEAINTEEQQYGSDRLLDCLTECRDKSAGEQLAILKADLDAFTAGVEQFDDITIMGMKIKE